MEINLSKSPPVNIFSTICSLLKTEFQELVGRLYALVQEVVLESLEEQRHVLSMHKECSLSGVPEF